MNSQINEDSSLIGKEIKCYSDYFLSNHKSLSTYRSKFFIPAINVIAKQDRTDLNWQDDKGNTILHNMVNNNADNEVIKRIVELGAEINILNNSNKTPVDIAAKSDNFELTYQLSTIKVREDKIRLEKLASEHAEMKNHTDEWKKSSFLRSILDEHETINASYMENRSESSDTRSTVSETASPLSTQDTSTQKYFSIKTNHSDRLSTSYYTARSR